MARGFRTRKETEYTGPMFAWDRQTSVPADESLGATDAAAEPLMEAETEVIDLAAEFIDLNSVPGSGSGRKSGSESPDGSDGSGSPSQGELSAQRTEGVHTDSFQDPNPHTNSHPRTRGSRSRHTPATPPRRPHATAATRRHGKRFVAIVAIAVILALVLITGGALAGYRYYRLAISDCMHYQYAYQQSRAHLEAVAAEIDNAGDITVSEPSGIYDDSSCNAKQLPTTLAGRAHKFKTAWQQVETEITKLRKQAASDSANTTAGTTSSATDTSLLPMDLNLSGSTTAFANAIAHAQWMLDTSKDTVADSSTRIKLQRAIESALADTGAVQGTQLSTGTDLATRDAAADTANPALDSTAIAKSADTASGSLPLQTEISAVRARAGHVKALNKAVNAVVKSQNRKLGIDCSVQKCVALTFDDGPNEVSPQVVQTLQNEGVQATFFAVGQTVGAGSDSGSDSSADDSAMSSTMSSTMAKALATGSVIGDHTWNHTDLPSMSSADRAQQLVDTNRAVQSVTGQPVRLLRPPHGAFDEASRRTAVAMNLGLVDYDVDSYDWKSLNALKTREKILAQVRPGSIVLMHDIHQSTADALPDVIHDLRRLGFTLVTVPQLLDGYPAPGEVVYSRAMRVQW
ncbi:polysaccharide deacetylase family protein [Bifidobacterium callimiconis]|uniref:Polysaccharide deacetylase n=1 Tax=Bifidobacterium callimiconis TaxID=2306973 RepID=A0A430FDI3_9BIFI|nr:polysaccharide deacetylase family protein [Bifidobacterium callimiconis]RSX50870.1 Polysaccharide deacetylase [Bifidobacterium callimiconis]